MKNTDGKQVPNNYLSTNSLDAFNFDSENTCKEMLEQVKKVVEYNTNFINKNTSNNFDKNDIDNSSNNINFRNSNNQNFPYSSMNSMYSNNIHQGFNNNSYLGLENGNPFNYTGGAFVKNKNFIQENYKNNYKEKYLKNNEENQRTFFIPNNNSMINNQGGSLSDYTFLNNNIANIDHLANIEKSKNFVPNKMNIESDLKNANNHISNNSFQGIVTGNFFQENENNINEMNADKQAPDNNDALVNSKNINENMVNVNSLLRTSRNSRSANISVLHDYKLSLDGKINNLKKIINQKMGFNKFRNLSNEVMINILKYFNTYDLNPLLYMNSYMKHKLLSIITDYSRMICQEFKEKFKNYFLLKDSQIYISNNRKNRKFLSKINLVLKFQIIDSSLKNKTIILGYLSKFFGENESLKNFFRFDVRPQGPISFWLMREYTSVII